MSEGQANNRAWWGIVLPSGEGAATRRLVFRETYGQGSSPVAGPEHDLPEAALGRATQLVEGNRLIAVLGHGDRARLRNAQTGCVVLEEPARRGTCPSVFLAVTYILAREPEATALIFPLDATPVGNGHLLKAVERAARLADRFDDRLVMLAVEPGWPHSELGWVEPGPVLENCQGGELLAVRRFWDTPGPLEAELFLKRGYLRSTMIIAVKVRTLWSLGREVFPEMMKRFESLLDVCKLVMAGRANPELETLALRDVYRGLETINFARRVLHRMPDRIALLPLRSGAAQDRGTASRSSADSDQLPAPPTRLRLA